MSHTVRSYAKINWALRITGKRTDGFHDLETLFQEISLYDELTFERSAEFVLTCSDPSIPTDDSNLIARAAKAIGAPPVAIHLAKKIPAGGGLGGGSANAATTLRVLDRMFGLATPEARMREIALTLGSDVPFFLVGGTAYATGRGEVLTRLDGMRGVPLLVVLPEERVLTKEAFAGIRSYSRPEGIDAFRAAVGSDFFAHGDLLLNDFEPGIFAKLPRLAGYRQRLVDHGAIWARMSGSGSTIVGAFASAATRDEALAYFPDVRAVAAESRQAASGLDQQALTGR